MTGFYIQVFILQTIAILPTAILAIDSNQLILGLMSLLGIVVGTVGIVLVAMMNNRTIMAGFNAEREDRREAANLLRAETKEAAAKVAENVAATTPLSTDEPIKVEVVASEEKPVLVDIVKKEEK